MYLALWTPMWEKKIEKTAKYGALGAEAERMWDLKAQIIPVIVGGLGAVTKNLGCNLAKITGTPDSFICQKISLLGSRKILHDILRQH